MVSTPALACWCKCTGYALLDHRRLFSYIAIEFIHGFIQPMRHKGERGFHTMVQNFGESLHFIAREILKDKGSGVHPSGGTTDTESHAWDILGAQLLQNGGQPTLPAGSSRCTDADGAKGNIQIIREDHHVGEGDFVKMNQSLHRLT